MLRPLRLLDITIHRQSLKTAQQATFPHIRNLFHYLFRLPSFHFQVKTIMFQVPVCFKFQRKVSQGCDSQLAILDKQIKTPGAFRCRKFGEVTYSTGSVGVEIGWT
jgi:hypothetical protein